MFFNGNDSGAAYLSTCCGFQRSGSKATFRISYPWAPLSLMGSLLCQNDTCVLLFFIAFAHKLLNMIASGGGFVKVINRKLRMRSDFMSLAGIFAVNVL